MNNYSFCTVFLIFYLVLSCQNKQKIEFDLVSNLNKYAKTIKSRQVSETSKICTKKGFNSIMEWSDSLKNQELLNAISRTFASNSIVYSQPNDSTYNLGIEPLKNQFYGQSTGEITLIMVNNELKIDSYRGGSIIKSH